MMQNELGFQSEIYFTPDGNYGDFDENTNTWNGIVQEVLSGQADFAIDISINSIRAKYLDFAPPFIHVALNILVLKDLRVNEEIQWSSWLEPFQYELWIFILGFINVILLVTWWIDRKSPYGHYRQVDSGDDGFTLLDSMTYVWGVAFGKDIGAEKTPHSSSARCVSTFYAFFALIVVNTYCANLMAFLVQEQFVLPINGIRDEKIRHPSLMPPNGFKLGVQENSQEESYFKFHSEDMFREIYRVNLQVNFVKNFADGLEKLKNREIHGLVGDYLSLSQVANNDVNCSYSFAGPNFFNFGLGLALPKASPWLHDVNQAVLKHHENGTIETIERRWFNKKTCDLNPFKQLEIINLSGLFMTVVIIIAFCILAIFVEFGIVIAMIKLGDRLGAIGKFMKSFVLNVKEGEEAHLHMQYSFIFRRQRKASWDIAAANARVARITGVELGFHNNEHCSSREQSLTSLGHANSDMIGNGNITTNGVYQMNSYAHTNGHISRNRTRKLKETEMMTTL
ncbi:glutamate receptor ionotropic, NMDA 1-like [Stylophora pistillata]|uniref:glutamate receptor ionotropic, NMDA 1-like n=1 Tax=Stylophora pistillata TaxID=50429 RepID=UPI000C03A531|nr:glutamate receptor ionotropic, NMDA 1-like [Stylophora pistillata]